MQTRIMTREELKTMLMASKANSMSALLSQISELLSVHHAAFSYGRKGYMVAVGDRVFEAANLSDVVYDAWGYVHGEEFTNA